MGLLLYNPKSDEDYEIADSTTELRQFHLLVALTVLKYTPEANDWITNWLNDDRTALNYRRIPAHTRGELYNQEWPEPVLAFVRIVREAFGGDGNWSSRGAVDEIAEMFRTHPNCTDPDKQDWWDMVSEFFCKASDDRTKVLYREI